MAFNPHYQKQGSLMFPMKCDSNGNAPEDLAVLKANYVYAGKLIKRGAAHTAPGDGAQNLTAAPLPEGVFFHAAAGAAATWTLPTAAAIETAYPGIIIGDAFDFYINNNSANTVTLAINTGITAIEGTDVVLTTATNTTKTYRLRKTAAATFKLYCLAAGTAFS